MKKYTLKITGLTIEILDSEGSGDAIFLLHGNSSSVHTFNDMYASDLAERYRLIAINLPGHGASSVTTNISIPLLAELVFHITEHFAFSRYMLIGHSVGGHIFSHALPHLSGCRGLILISAPPLSLSTLAQAFKPDPVQGALFSDQLTPEQIQAMTVALLGNRAGGHYHFTKLMESISTTAGSFRALLGQSLMAGQLDNECECIASADVPVAMIWGEQDVFINPGFYEQLTFNRYLGNGFYAFTHSGHSPHIDASGAVIKIVAELAALQLQSYASLKNKVAV